MFISHENKTFKWATLFKVMDKLLKAKIRCKKYGKINLELSQFVPALHIAGFFSSVKIFDCIYNRLKINKDKFVLSKNYAGILQYVVLNNLGIIKTKDLHNYHSIIGEIKWNQQY